MKMLSNTILAVTLLTSISSNSLFATAIPFDCGKELYGPIKLTRGFSGCEGTHRWTEGGQAEVVIQQNGFMQNISFIDLHAFTPQTITVSVNAGAPTPFVFDHNNPKHTITIALPRDIPQTRILFDLPGAVSPTSLGGDDPRILGLSFVTGTLVCDTPLSPEAALERALKLQVQNTLHPDQYADSTHEFWNESGSFRLSSTTKLELYNESNRMHDLERPGAYYIVKDPELKGILKWEARVSAIRRTS